MGHFTRDSTPFADTDVAKAVTYLTIAKFIFAAKRKDGNGVWPLDQYKQATRQETGGLLQKVGPSPREVPPVAKAKQGK